MFIESLLNGIDAKLAARQSPLLESRQNAAASLGMHMYAFRVLLADAFASEDMDFLVHQLIYRSRGKLEVFADDRDLLMRAFGEIIQEFDLRPQTPRNPGLPGTGSNDSSATWIRNLYREVFVGPPDHDQWRDHGI